jgi:hypothetical protein
MNKITKFDGRKLDHKTLEAIRLRAVQSVEAGQSPEAIALNKIPPVLLT